MGATTMPRPQKPIAWPRFSGGKASNKIACESGCSPPPQAPCTIRKKIRKPSVGAKPHRKDAAVKPTTEAVNRRLRPNLLRSEEHTSELQSLRHLVCRLL